MELRLNANALIFNDEGKILTIRLKKGAFKGRVSLPGGGIKPGELSKDTIRREILEETGILLNKEIKPFGFCELIHNPYSSHRIVLLLHSIADGTPIETEEGIGQWQTYEEAKDDFIPFAKETIRIWNEKHGYFKLIE